MKAIVWMKKASGKGQLIMSIILLAMVTLVACRVDKIVEKESKETETTNGKTVIIDPGHGGKDPGKVGFNDIKEKDVNLAIALKIVEQLKESGYKVLITRTNEDNLPKIEDLNKRCDLANKEFEENPNTILVSIHQNSFTSESVHGAQSFYYQRSDDSKLIADTMQQLLNEKINDKDKEAKPNDSYYILINTKCPGIIVECGFLSNKEESSKLIEKDYQQKIADLVTKGIDTYFDKKGF